MGRRKMGERDPQDIAASKAMRELKSRYAEPSQMITLYNQIVKECPDRNAFNNLICKLVGNTSGMNKELLLKSAWTWMFGSQNSFFSRLLEQGRNAVTLREQTQQLEQLVVLELEQIRATQEAVYQFLTKQATDENLPIASYYPKWQQAVRATIRENQAAISAVSKLHQAANLQMGTDTLPAPDSGRGSNGALQALDRIMPKNGGLPGHVADIASLLGLIK